MELKSNLINGNMDVRINVDTRAYRLVCGEESIERIYTSMIEYFDNYEEEALTDGIVSAVYLKALVIPNDMEPFEMVVGVGEKYNDWLTELEGSILNMVDTQYGVGYNFVVVIGAEYDTKTSQVRFLSFAGEVEDYE